MLSNATANEEKHELWWSIYAWWSCVLVLKMMYLTWRTGMIRVEHQIGMQIKSILEYSKLNIAAISIYIVFSNAVCTLSFIIDPIIVIHSEEDKMWMTKKPEIILCPTGNGHSDVERIRYAHRKDLETVLPFLIIVPLWLNVETYNFTVRVLIPSFALANILYTSIYMQLLQMSSLWKSYSFVTMYCILTYICIIAALEYTITLQKLFSFLKSNR